MKNDAILTAKPAQARSGWTEAFIKAGASNPETLPETFIDDSLSNDFDQDEWVW